MSIKCAMLKTGVTVLRGLYAPLKLQKQQNQITIISRQSREMTTDIYLLSDYIATNFPDINLKVMVRFIEPGIGSRIRYGLHMISQMNAIARSKIVVLDGYCIAASVLKHKQGTEIVQMWHSMAAIKKFGHQTIDKAAGHSRDIADVMCMHRNYDKIICPSAETGKYFCQGFNYRSDKLVEMALPRIDFIRKCMEPECVNRIRAGISGNKEVLLYAPTFRKKTGLDATELLNAIDFEKFTLVIKPHPLYEEDLKALVEEMRLEGNVILDNEHSTFEWLGACDRVITDYSAVAVESLVTGKPLYFYLYDLEDYKDTVGINVNPLEEMPHASAIRAGELAEIIDREYDYEELAKFRKKYLTADTSDCTKRLGDYLYGIIEKTL